ncbi:MAG: hypothetical protein ACHQY2_01010 [Candidatus Eremiobacterales bacterium]|jgi:hypothetical protein
MDEKNADRQKDWVNAHMGRTSKETAHRLLTTDQPRPPENSPVLSLRGVRARCVAGGASNFWIVKSEAAEPILDGDFPLTGMSPTALFVKVPRFNYLPYAVRRADLTPDNHTISGETSPLEAAMREVYG